MPVLQTSIGNIQPSWTVYSVGPQVSAPSVQGSGLSASLTLSPRFDDGTPALYQFNDPSLGQSENSFGIAFNLNLNMGNQSNQSMENFVVDLLLPYDNSNPPASSHPNYAHFHPNQNPSNGRFQAIGYKVNYTETTQDVISRDFNSSNRAVLQGNPVPNSTSALWNGGRVHQIDGTFFLIVSPIAQANFAAANGFDISRAAYTLKTEHFNPELSGTIGNDFLYGSDAYNNVMNGLGGNDLLMGTGGNDTLNGGAGIDRLFGGADNDVLIGETGQDWLEGGDGIDQLLGGDDDDYLGGGLGDDYLSGGYGFDTIVGGEGVDTVDYSFYFGRSIINLLTGEVDFPGANPESKKEMLFSIENVLSGSGSDTIIGDNHANELRGEGGNDTIYGGLGDDKIFGGADSDILLGDEGADLMVGGGGNDLYSVDNALDVVVAGSDYDEIYSSVNLTSPDNVETLFLIGSATYAAGNSGNNALIGNGLDNIIDAGAGTFEFINGLGGSDILIGGTGHDEIMGGDGNDLFRFTSVADAFNGATNTGDFLYDFTPGQDKIQLNAAAFGIGTATNPLVEGRSFINGPDVTSAVPTLLYNRSSGYLIYDTDGTGSQAPVVLAVLNGTPALSASDISVY